MTAFDIVSLCIGNCLATSSTPCRLKATSTTTTNESTMEMEMESSAADDLSSNNNNNASGDVGYQGSDAGAAHRRGYQACDPCRKRKVKCDLGSAYHASSFRGL